MGGEDDESGWRCCVSFDGSGEEDDELVEVRVWWGGWWIGRGESLMRRMRERWEFESSIFEKERISETGRGKKEIEKRKKEILF